LRDCVAVFGAEREAVLARELTKQFETVLDGTFAQLAARVDVDADQQRGEFVLLVRGAESEGGAAQLAEGRRVYKLLCAELPPSRAAKLAAEITGAPRKALYEA
jgi:16S rRNA (cytidine1402-2'-O)-methyltransferase